MLEVDIPAEASFGAPGVLGGDLLFSSGLMACDGRGANGSIAAATGLAHFGAPARAEMGCLLQQATQICVAAGTTAASITRATQFHTDLSGFRDTLAMWDQIAGVRSIPYCAVKAASHPVSGCTTTLDFWAWAGR